MLLDLVPVLAPVFIAAGIGFGWARSGQDFETGFVTRLVMLVGTPCLAFSTLTRLQVDLATFGTIALAAVLAIAGFGAIGFAVLRAAGIGPRVYLPSLMLPNTGNMGLPLVLFAFGERGLALAIVFAAIVMIGHFTLGVALVAGRSSLRAVLTAPVIYAIAAALPFLGLALPVPRWLANTTELLAGLTIPLMLISLGVSLASLRVGNFRLSAGLSVLRLGMGVAVGAALPRLLGLDPVAAGVVTVQCAMPAAVFNYLLAARYGSPAEEIAGTVVVSTLLSFATLPLLLWAVL